MKKTFSILITVTALVFQTNAQTFDITTYKISKAWKVDKTNPNALSLIKTNETTGSYCIIYISKALPVQGTPIQDYKTTWQKSVTETVQAPLPSDSAINMEKRKDGRTAIGAVGTFTKDNVENAIILYTYANTQNKIAITVITNSNEYGDEIDKFSGDLIIAKGKTITNTAKPSAAITTKPTTATSNISKVILGEWYLSDGNIKIALAFAANGSFGRSFTSESAKPIALNLYQTNTWSGNGTYTVNGTTLTLTPRSGAKEEYQIRFSTDNTSSGQTKILHLKRPVAGGEMYESDYYFVK